jgi:hypothetical protein
MIFITTFPDYSERRRAMRGGAVEYLGNANRFAQKHLGGAESV